MSHPSPYSQQVGDCMSGVYEENGAGLLGPYSEAL